MAVDEFRPFKSITGVILDDVLQTAESKFWIPSIHDIKNQRFREALETYTNAEVISVGIAKGEPIQNAHNQILSIVEGKRVDDLLIVYFNGSAGFVDKKYMFKFQGNMSGYFNANELIWRLSISKATCLFLLDCDVYTRVIKKWQEAFQNTEVIGRGTAYRDPENETIDNKHDFTVRLCHDLEYFAKRNKPGGKGKGKTARTIPQLMQADKLLMSNPLRVKSGKMECSYVQAHPKHVCENEKIHFGSTGRDSSADVEDEEPAAVAANTPSLSYTAGHTPRITNPAFRQSPHLFSDEGYISDGEDENDEEMFVRK